MVMEKSYVIIITKGACYFVYYYLVIKDEQSFKMCQMPFLEEAYHFVSGIPKWEIPGNFEWTVLYRGKSGYRVPGLRKHLNVLSSF